MEGEGAGGWPTGAAPVHSGDNPNLPAGTIWDGGPIWVRKSFEIESVPDSLWLGASCAVDSEAVYLDGEQTLDFESARDTTTIRTSPRTSAACGSDRTCSPRPASSRQRCATTISAITSWSSESLFSPRDAPVVDGRLAGCH